MTIEGPHGSQEQYFDEKNVSNEDPESLLTFSGSTFDMNTFAQDNQDLYNQWQMVDFPPVYPSQDAIEPGDGPWVFDMPDNNFSNTYFPEPATSNTPFDSCNTLDNSLSNFESDGWLTSFLESPEPILYPSSEVPSFLQQRLPYESSRPSIELPLNNEGLSTSIPEVDSSSNQIKDDIVIAMPSEPRPISSNTNDQPTSLPNVAAVASPQNIEDCLIDFHSGIKAPKRKRKEFNRREKLKVHLVRQVGACQSCRARKVEVCLANFLRLF